MVEKYKDIIPSLLAAHSLSGCDTVTKMLEIGKGKVFSVVKRCSLNFLGRADSDVEDYIQEGKQFVAQCYGMREPISSKNRLLIFLVGINFCMICFFRKIHKNVYKEN